MNKIKANQPNNKWASEFNRQFSKEDINMTNTCTKVC